MADKQKQDEAADAATPADTGSAMPEQVEDDANDAPERPDADEAGEGEQNSARPIQDEARPDNLNTMGW